MSYILRRKDPPAYDGAPEQPWKTVAHRETFKEIVECCRAMRRYSKKPGTRWWYGEDKGYYPESEEFE